MLHRGRRRDHQNAAALRALRRRDFPPLDHPAIRQGKGRNAHAKRLAEAFASTIFPHVEVELLGLGRDARPRRALLGASYSSTLALQVLLALPMGGLVFALHHWSTEPVLALGTGANVNEV